MLNIRSHTTIDKVDVIRLERLLKDIEFKTSYVGTKLMWIALVPVGFDIEATRQFMYLWTLSIKNLTIVGYTWDEYRNLLAMINNVLNLGVRKYTVGHRGTAYTKTVKHKDGTVETKTHYKNDGEKEEKFTAPYVFPIFIHNLRYEYAFMKNEFNFRDVFFLDTGKRNPLSLFDGTFLYVDSYKICPKKLEDLAKAYCTIQKTHDLDYHIDRNTDDAKNLSDAELMYCVKDTQILVEFADFVFNNYFLKYGRLPLTQNQIIKIIIRHFYNDLSEDEKAAADKLLYATKITQDQYLFIRDEGGRGGHCASSLREIIGDVLYADEDSAYCAQIVHGLYPMSGYRAPRHAITTEQDLDEYAEDRCFQARVKFYNLIAKGSKLVKYESRNKVTWCMPDGSYPKTHEDFAQVRKTIKTTSSGKIWKAACIETSINEVDWDIYKKCYEWDRIEITRFEQATKDKLPDFIIKVALILYGEKAKLKKAGIKGPKYASTKALVANVFGAMVQQICKEVVFGDEDTWFAKLLDNLIRPQWGVYVAANARKVLVDTILEYGIDNWGYSDTDSIFGNDNEYTRSIINKYNEEMRRKNKAMCEAYGLDYNIYCDLGCWDDDNKHIVHFKTLGSKCYLYMTAEKEFKLVMSGVPEQFFWEAYDKKYATRNEKDVFEFFNEKTEITYTRHKVIWVDEETTEVINGMTMTSKSGCIIKDEVITGPLMKISELIAAEHVLEEANKDVI